MTTELSPRAVPEASSRWEEWYDRRCERHLTLARRLVADLKDDSPGAPPAEDVLRVWNDVNIALGNVFAISSVLSQVHPHELGLDRALYDVLAAVDASALETGARRVLQLSLRDFRRGGSTRTSRSASASTSCRSARPR